MRNSRSSSASRAPSRAEKLAADAAVVATNAANAAASAAIVTAEAAIESRRTAKRELISLQTMLRSKDISSEDKKEMLAQVMHLRTFLNNKNNLHNNSSISRGNAEPEITKEEIESRRQFLQDNVGLRDTFRALWIIFSPYTEAGILTRDGYLKLQQVVHVALIGTDSNSLDDICTNLDNDLAHDHLMFGKLNEQGFYDLIFEIIETWSEILDPHYYAAFAWSLLDTIANTTEHPPKLRPLREIKCITKIENEASMIRSYAKGKKVRAALAIEAEWLSRVPDVQKRLHSRKKGTELNMNHQNMINVLSLAMGKERQNQNDNDSDSEDQSISESGTKESARIANPDMEKQEINKQDGGPQLNEQRVSDNNNCDTSVTSNRSSDSRRSTARDSTESFMNYVQSTRGSKITMNGTHVLQTSDNIISDEEVFENEDKSREKTKSSFSNFISSGKSLDEYKRNQHELGGGADRKKRPVPTKFDIESQMPGSHDMSDENSVTSSTYSFFGNKDAKLVVSATAISPDRMRKDNKSTSVKRQMNPAFLNSSYLLKIEASEKSVSSSTCGSEGHSVREKNYLSITTSPPYSQEAKYQKNLAETSKYGIGKLSDTVVVDANLFSERMETMQANVGMISFNDEESLSSNNSNIAVRTFPNSAQVEPSHGKFFHDPLSPQLLEAFRFSSTSNVKETKQQIEQPGPDILRDTPSDPQNESVQESPSRGRFQSLIEGVDKYRPSSAEVALVYSKSSWDIHRAVQNAKMDSSKKLQLLETMKQATAASLLENSSQSSRSLVQIQSVRKKSVSSSPIEFCGEPKKELEPIPLEDGVLIQSEAVLIGDIAEQPQKLSLDDENTFDDVVPSRDSKASAGDDIEAVTTTEPLNIEADTHAPFLVAPINDSEGNSVGSSSPSYRRLSIFSRGSSQDNVSKETPPLLSHPFHAASAHSKKSSQRLYLEQSKSLNRSTTSNKPSKSVSVAELSDTLLPELLIKPIIELPHARSTKSRINLASNEQTPATDKNMLPTFNSPPRTNSPSPIRRLQRPTSPVMVEEAKSLLNVQGSLASVNSFLPNNREFGDSNSRFFSHTTSVIENEKRCIIATKTMGNGKAPWLPRGNLAPMDHDHNDLIEGWREKIELLRYQPFDPAKIPMTIKNQSAAKQAFEQYVKSLS